METRYTTDSDRKEVLRIADLLIDCIELNKCDPTYASNAMCIIIHDMLTQSGVEFDEFVRVFKIQWQQLDKKKGSK